MLVRPDWRPGTTGRPGWTPSCLLRSRGSAPVALVATLALAGWTACAPDVAQERGQAAPADADADAAAAADSGPLDAGDAQVAPPPTPPPGASVALRFPIRAEDRALIGTSPILHVDHDPADRSAIECRNYAGDSFPGCYDGHRGTDYLLAGGLETMDGASAVVVAAAGGRVVEAEDGNYDRCHASLSFEDVSCDGHPMVANRVALEHANGWRTAYYHLRKGSVRVAVGDVVACGEPVGLVGSSGRSAMPHLHLEVEAPDGKTADPYAPEEQADASLWVEQDAGDGLPADVCAPEWRVFPAEAAQGSQ